MELDPLHQRKLEHSLFHELFQFNQRKFEPCQYHVLYTLWEDQIIMRSCFRLLYISLYRTAKSWFIQLHSYLACMILVRRPFKWHHAMTLTFDLLLGQLCCRAEDHNSLNLLVLLRHHPFWGYISFTMSVCVYIPLPLCKYIRLNFHTAYYGRPDVTLSRGTSCRFTVFVLFVIVKPEARNSFG